MKMYAKVINEETKACEVGTGTNTAFYQSIGMSKTEVEQAYDGSWYLKGYAPEKPTEQKEAEVRAERDRRLDAMRWRIERYQMQTSAGIDTTDDAETYHAILLYCQYLRDIPQGAGEWWNAPILTFEEWGAKQ